jgi:hypothetical protein
MPTKRNRQQLLAARDGVHTEAFVTVDLAGGDDRGATGSST